MDFIHRVSKPTALVLVIGAPFATHASELVINGNFEAGSFSGWETTPGQPDIDPLYFGVDQTGPKNQRYSAYFGDATSTYNVIEQHLATSAGVQYTISFWLDSAGTQGSGPASFRAAFGDEALLVLSNADQDVDFKRFSFQLTAVTSDTLLRFSAYNSPSFYTLDDVSVSAVPDAPGIVTFPLGVMAVTGWLRARRKYSTGQQPSH